MPQTATHRIDQVLAADAQDRRPWDVHAACKRYYWKRETPALRLRSSAATQPLPTASVTAQIQAGALPQALTELGKFGGSVAVLGWTTLGEEQQVLLSVENPVLPATSEALLGVPGVLSLTPDRDRTARYARRHDATCFSPAREPIAPLTAARHSMMEVEEQEAFATMNLPQLVRSPHVQPYVIAVIDDGLHWDHEYVAPLLWRNTAEIEGKDDRDDDGNGMVNDTIGWNFYCSSPDPRPYNFRQHGTKVAGLIAAIANHCEVPVQIMPLRIDGPGSPLSLAGLAMAVNYAARNGARTIVIARHWSLKVIDAEEQAEFAAFRTAVAEARIRGALIVCAAGNERLDISTNNIEPAKSGLDTDNVLTVQGVGPSFSRSNFSSVNADQLIVAPAGRNVRSITITSQQHARFFMTSAATAIVAGVSAVVATLKNLQDPAVLKSVLLGCRDPDTSGSKGLEARLLNLDFLP